MIWYFKSNQKQNNRNRKEIKERERRKLPGATYLAQHGLAHLHSPRPCRLPLPVGRGEAWRAPERPRPPPASPWPPPASSSTPRRRHAPPCLSPSLSRVLILSPGPLSHSPERSRRHRRAPSRPPPPPSLADALKGSASTPSFSPPSHKVPDTLQRRHHRRFHRRPPRIFTVDSPPSPLPRARHLPHPNHRELLHVLPLTPWLAARRSRHFIAGRSTPPPELVAGIAPVTIWSPWHA